MVDLLRSKIVPQVPPRTGRTAVKRHLGNRTDPDVGIVECGNEILIRFELSPLVPLHMANKQIQGVVVSSDGGLFR